MCWSWGEAEPVALTTVVPVAAPVVFFLTATYIYPLVLTQLPLALEAQPVSKAATPPIMEMPQQ